MELEAVVKLALKRRDRRSSARKKSDFEVYHERNCAKSFLRHFKKYYERDNPKKSGAWKQIFQSQGIEPQFESDLERLLERKIPSRPTNATALIEEELLKDRNSAILFWISVQKKRNLIEKKMAERIKSNNCKYYEKYGERLSRLIQ